MKPREMVRFLILRSIGNFLLLFALFGVCATFGPAIYYELNFRIEQLQGVKYTVASANQAQFGQILASAKEKILIPKDPQFDILIPKIGANAKVLPEIDPTNENMYLPALSQGVAHALGSSLPGGKGTVYLFAHSTDNFWDVGRYNAVFYLVKDLEKGDNIVIFYQERRYNYTVVDKKIVDPSDVSLLVNSMGSGPQLVLQTCWPPGTTLKRIIVIAKPN